MSTPKRVIQILRRYAPEQWGCNEQVAHNTSRELLKLGVESLIFTTSDARTQAFENNAQVRYFNYFYPYLFLGNEVKEKLDLKGGNPYSFSMASALLREDYDLVHCHTHSRLAATARLIARRRNIPYIVSLSSWQSHLPTEMMAELSKSTKRAPGFGRLLDLVTQPKRVIRDASGIVCNSFEDYQRVKRNYPLTPSLYLPGAVSIANTNDVASHLNCPNVINQSKTQLLCVGRIDSQKNQSLLIELVNKLNKFAPGKYQLNLVGHIANQSYFEHLHSKILEYGLIDQVAIHTQVQPNSNELAAFYQYSDVFISPSIHEPFCLTILEAWNAGLPVLAANIDSIKSVVLNKITGLLFNPYDLDSLCVQLLALEASSPLRESLIRNSQVQVAQNHSWTSYTEKLMQFYHEVDAWYRSQHLYRQDLENRLKTTSARSEERHCEH